MIRNGKEIDSIERKEINGTVWEFVFYDDDSTIELYMITSQSLKKGSEEKRKMHIISRDGVKILLKYIENYYNGETGILRYSELKDA